MWAGRQPARYLSTISLRPCSVVRALPWDTRTFKQVLGLRQATPHSEVLLRSTPTGRHKRSGWVQLGGRPCGRSALQPGEHGPHAAVRFGVLAEPELVADSGDRVLH